MDSAQFKAFTDEWKKKGALDFTRKSHYEKMSPLFVPHAEVVIAKKNEFHLLTGGQFYPHKDLADRFRMAAGVSFTGETKIEKQPDGAWVCTSFAQEMGPDGNMVPCDPTCYEFNPADRAEEDLLKKAIADNTEMPDERHIRLKTLEYRKVSLRRANTGARVAAIIGAIGMPTGFKFLFDRNDKDDDIRIFLFSRIIFNAENKTVMDRALNNMAPMTRLLTGESGDETIRLIGSNEDDDLPPDIKEAEPIQGTSVETLARNAVGTVDDFEGVDEAFGPPPDSVLKELMKDISPRGLVKYARVKYEKELSDKVKSIMDKYLDNDRSTDEQFENLYAQAKDYLGKRGIEI